MNKKTTKKVNEFVYKMKKKRSHKWRFPRNVKTSLIQLSRFFFTPQPDWRTRQVINSLATFASPLLFLKADIFFIFDFAFSCVFLSLATTRLLPWTHSRPYFLLKRRLAYVFNRTQTHTRRQRRLGRNLKWRLSQLGHGTCVHVEGGVPARESQQKGRKKRGEN